MRKHAGASDAENAILLICPEAPYPPAGGGALRTASILEFRRGRYPAVVIVFRAPGAPDPRPAFPPGVARDVCVLQLPYHSRGPLARASRNAGRLLLGRPPLNDRFSGFAAPIAAFLKGRRYRAAIVEHFWCAPYLDQVRPHAGRVLLDLHNVESVLYERLAAVEPWPASLAYRRFARACRRLERKWLPGFSSLLVASKADAIHASGIAPRAAIELLPNTIPLVPAPSVREEHVIAFSGNLEYPPNVSAVRWFHDSVWPLLRSRDPRLVWRIVGKNPRGIARWTAGDPRIELRGSIPDAVRELAAARVVVVPVLAGSGTRVKILEAWAAARAVVSTTVGAEGIPASSGEHLLLADASGDFASAVSSLLESGERRANIGRAARLLYESEFTWTRAAEILDPLV